MKLKPKIYLGVCGWPSVREIFRSIDEPSFETHGDQYAAVIGPFRTMRGAVFMRDRGKGNVHCQCVNDAERLGRKSEPFVSTQKDKAVLAYHD